MFWRPGFKAQQRMIGGKDGETEIPGIVESMPE